MEEFQLANPASLGSLASKNGPKILKGEEKLTGMLKLKYSKMLRVLLEVLFLIGYWCLNRYQTGFCCSCDSNKLDCE